MTAISPGEYIQSTYKFSLADLAFTARITIYDAYYIFMRLPLSDYLAQQLEYLGRSKESWLEMDKNFQNSKKR